MLSNIINDDDENKEYSIMFNIEGKNTIFRVVGFALINGSKFGEFPFKEFQKLRSNWLLGNDLAGDKIIKKI